MKINELIELLNAEVFSDATFDLDQDFRYAFGSDLMSDALMLLRTAPDSFFEHGVLLTGLVTAQSIRTAEMLDFKVLILIRGKKPNQNVIDAAKESNILVLGTKDSMFTASGKMYAQGFRGVTEIK